MDQAREELRTQEGSSLPAVRQISVFLDNRVGQLLRLIRVFEGEDVHILALSVIDSVDYAVVRLLFDDPDTAAGVLHEAGFAFSVKEVLAIELPHGDRGLLNVLSALLSAEINVAYVYPLLPRDGVAAVALSPDTLEAAIETLQRRKVVLLSERDLGDWT